MTDIQKKVTTLSNKQEEFIGKLLSIPTLVNINDLLNEHKISCIDQFKNASIDIFEKLEELNQKVSDLNENSENYEDEETNDDYGLIVYYLSYFYLNFGVYFRLFE